MTKLIVNFECNQDWDQMQNSKNGKLCNLCQKEIIDFTKWDKKAIINAIKQDTNLCGRFNHEDVDPTIIKPISIHSKISLNSILLATSLNLSTSYSYSNAHVDLIEWTNSTNLNNKELLNVKINKSIKNFKKDPEKLKLFHTGKKRHFYWSNKFPFIKIKRRKFKLGGYRTL